jgi:hypothetical protein
MGMNGKNISERFKNEVPVVIRINNKEVAFEKNNNDYIARQGDFEAVLKVEPLTSVEGKRWKLIFSNQGKDTIRKVTIIPLHQIIAMNDDKYADEPAVRWFNGSQWRDGQYPPVAFTEHERRFLTNNNCAYWEKPSGYKPVFEISGKTASNFIPMMQFAVTSGDERMGCTVFLEWSASWQMSASWQRLTEELLSSPSDFVLKAGYHLDNITVDPGETLETPFIHLIYSHGQGWDAFTNDVHKYILNEISPKLKNFPSPLPVSYDHWFGLAQRIDINEMKRQADRAAEIGCEYFTLDCGWSIPTWGSTVVDTTRFPNGIGELADYVRSKGMRFGIWNSIERGAEHVDFWKPEIQQYHYGNIEKWIKDWGIEWMRLEGAGYAEGKDALKAHKGMHDEVYGKLIRDYPDFYIENCQSGGQRLDLNMARTTHGNWLSDHTGEPDATRYHQLGALRVWPARYLNMAVEVFSNTGDSLSNGHYILSRMATVLSFNGDIAEWSPEATAKVKKYVDIYKETRKYKEQPVFFPLPQPRNDREWDAVVYGDGKGEAQLLFVFRMNGPEQQLIQIPDAPGKWNLLIDNGNAKMKKTKEGYIISLKKNSSALWVREK